MSIKSRVKQILIHQQNKQYDKALSRRKITYSEWFLQQRRTLLAPQKKEPGEETFITLSLDEGAFVEDFCAIIEDYLSRNPGIGILYGDQDKMDTEGNISDPWFKPDWSPDLLDSCLYFGSYLVMERGLWRQYRGLLEGAYWPSDGEAQFRVTDLTLYEKWLHTCLEREGAYQKGNRSVGHISEVLFHSLEEDTPQKYLTKSDYLRDSEKQLFTGTTEKKPLVSVIIPSRDHPTLLRQCLEALYRQQKDVPYEVIVVDNGSLEENRCILQELLEQHTYLYEPMEFHFSRMCNLGAARAKGSLLLFLNDDVVLGENCLWEMAKRAGRAYTGAVGIKLLYPGGNRIQHAGITNLPMGPVHKLQFKEDTEAYYFNANRGERNFLAVTAACLMVTKDKFTESGGFSEALPVAFNDVDFCFRLYGLGYYNVCLNDVWGWHHESLSRGTDEAEEKLSRLLMERQKLYEFHPELEGRDPYYSIHLGREGLDTGIRPAYETAGNQMQRADSFLRLASLVSCREDDCLMARVESFIHNCLTGYGVVLGDNNACYERWLLLIREEQPEIYSLKLEGQFRPDLVDNLPDQERVALCGFQIKIETGTLPTGGYRVGMMARHRVSGLKLVKITNRSIVI